MNQPSQYTQRIPLIGTQWFRNGDHPQDDVFRAFEDTGLPPREPREGKIVRYFRHPGVPGKRSCDFCNDIMHNHGWIDSGGSGRIVCPGDYVVQARDGSYYAMKPKMFEALFTPKMEWMEGDPKPTSED